MPTLDIQKRNWQVLALYCGTWPTRFSVTMQTELHAACRRRMRMQLDKKSDKHGARANMAPSADTIGDCHVEEQRSELRSEQRSEQRREQRS
jgi:hypothetical protein